MRQAVSAELPHPSQNPGLSGPPVALALLRTTMPPHSAPSSDRSGSAEAPRREFAPLGRTIGIQVKVPAFDGGRRDAQRALAAFGMSMITLSALRFHKKLD